MTLGSFWTCFSTTEVPAPTTYQDILGVRYVYDSAVPNHKGVTDGDVVVIRDSEVVYGFGWVQSVRVEPRVKRMTLCSSCNRSGPTRRSTLSPAFRCNRCRAEFDEPVYEDRPLTSYEAEYGATWAPFPEPLPRSRLDDLYAGADRQNAIRRLDPDRAIAFLKSAASVYGTIELHEAATDLDGGPTSSPVGGHIPMTGRRRIGQQAFRTLLRQRFGDHCAVTGAQPAEILDAAHLYLFAGDATHHLDGGLLLRSDIHRLFDAYRLTIDPDTWTVRIAPALLYLLGDVVYYNGERCQYYPQFYEPYSRLPRSDRCDPWQPRR